MRRAWLLLGCAACMPRESQQQQAVQQCPMTTVEGIDVYAGNGTIDWMKVKAAGRDFAFIKATQGNYDTQSTFAANWSGALQAGVLRSPYHFFDGTIDGVAQAQWFLDELASVGGLQVGDLPPLLDLECPTSSSKSNTEANCEYNGDSGWVATATLKQRTYDWLMTVEQATGVKPFIYSYPSWFASVMFTDPMLAQYPLYIASYATCANVPSPWQSAVFWQYADNGTVSGVTGQVDEDRFVGSAGDLAGITIPPDAGVPPGLDAGIGDDAGMQPEQGAGKAGCGCGASSPGQTAWLALAVLTTACAGRRAGRGRGRSRPTPA
ncbi:MAG TPA: GH25 family lysozyme [Kofleriaceae bacterium]|nr:GH25 family lysozyme [Kofleriaceae bacterium]